MGVVVVVVYWVEDCVLGSELEYCYVIGILEVKYFKFMLNDKFIEICVKVIEIKGCKMVLYCMVVVEGVVIVEVYVVVI